MNIVKAVIFDMDGLMFDTEKLWEDAFYHIGKDFNVTLDAKFHMRTIGITEKNICAIFKKEFGQDFPFDEFLYKCRQYMDDIIKKGGLKQKKGLKELLEYLHSNNYLIAIASSSKRKRILWYLECAGIDRNIFLTIISGEDVTNGKPNPEIFLKASKLLKTIPEETIVLEDSNNGLIAAIAGEFISIAIPDIDILKKEVLDKVDYKFESLLDVIDLLKEGE